MEYSTETWRCERCGFSKTLCLGGYTTTRWRHNTSNDCWEHLCNAQGGPVLRWSKCKRIGGPVVDESETVGVATGIPTTYRILTGATVYHKELGWVEIVEAHHGNCEVRPIVNPPDAPELSEPNTCPCAKHHAKILGAIYDVGEGVKRIAVSDTREWSPGERQSHCELMEAQARAATALALLRESKAALLCSRIGKKEKHDCAPHEKTFEHDPAVKCAGCEEKDAELLRLREALSVYALRSSWIHRKIGSDHVVDVNDFVRSYGNQPWKVASDALAQESTA